MTAAPLEPAATPIEDGAWIEGRIGLLVMFLFFVVLLGWAALAPLDGGVYAPGVVKVSGNRTTVQHRDGGVIAAVDVRDGDHVKQGQILIDLSPTELLANERALAGQALDLEAMRARLQAESAGLSHIDRPAAWSALSPEDQKLADASLAREEQERAARAQALDAQASVYAQRKLQLKARIDGYQGEIAALDRQSKIAEDELSGLQALQAKGYAALNKVRDQERLIADIDRQRADLKSSIAEAQDSVGEMDLQIISLQQNRAQEIAADLQDTNGKLDDLLPKWSAARDQLERSRVRAPTSGTVVGLAFFNPGAVVKPGDRILDIVPDKQPLIVEARIRPQDAEDLRPGMTTDVRLSAFHSRTIPSAKGVVESVSADSITDERTGRAYFTADIAVSPEEIARLAKFSGETNIRLSAGMPVEIVVPLGKRTALDYLLQPLDQALWRSFREH